MKVSEAKERIRSIVARLESAWSGRLVPTLLILGVMFAYCVAYWTHYALPEPGTWPETSGWWVRHDPGKYRNQAEAISRLALDSETHHYFVGYALTAAPFALIDPQHAFFLPDLFFVTGTAGLLYLLARRFLGQLESALLVAAAAYACNESLFLAAIIPRSTIPTGMYAYAMLTLLVYREPSRRLLVGLVLLNGLTYITRPGDAVFLAPILVVAVLQLPTWRQRIWGGLGGMALLSLFPLAVRLLNQAVVQTAVSAYEAKHRSGFTFERFFETLYVCWLDGAPIYRDPHTPLLSLMPWALLALPGAVWAVRKDGWRQGVVFGTVLGSIGFYTAYWNMDPVGMWTFHLVRYITWTFPLLFLFAWLALRFGLWQLNRRVVALTLLPVVVAWFVRLEEVDAVPAAVQADGSVQIEGPEHPNGYDLIVLRRPNVRGSADVRLYGEELQNCRDMHKRRNYIIRTSLRGVILFLHDPVAPEALNLNPNLEGTPVELRRLKWTVSAVPAALMRRMTGNRLWGVDSLDRTASALREGDGAGTLTEKDHGTERVVTATFPNLGRGRYDVEIRGEGILTGARYRVFLNKQRIAKDELAPGPGNGLLGEERFKLGRVAKSVRVRIIIPADSDAKINEIRLSPEP